MNMIEGCWSDLKDECYPSWPRVHGSGKSAKLLAKSIVTEGWSAIRRTCIAHCEDFLERVEWVVARDGNNNFRG